RSVSDVVVFEDGAVVVGEVAAGGSSAVAEGAPEEGGHLSSGDEVVGAEAVVLGWVASAGYVGRSESVDVVFEDVAVVVGEVVARSWDDAPELPPAEDGEFPPGDEDDRAG